MPNILAAALTGAVGIYAFLHFLLRITQDAREPPMAPTAIPFFGHIAGMMTKKTKYYVELR
jgi:hypothetical protein